MSGWKRLWLKTHRFAFEKQAFSVGIFFFFFFFFIQKTQQGDKAGSLSVKINMGC